jgi:hypothetical protein
MTQPTPIKCPACECLFGYEVNGTLNIKHRDLFRSIEGGVVEGPCRRCGQQVRWQAAPLFVVKTP